METFRKQIAALSLFGLATGLIQATPVVDIRLPERFRLISDQLFDLRVEATTLTDTAATIAITVNGRDVTALLGTPEVATDNDANTADVDKSWTFRNLHFDKLGVNIVQATVTDRSGAGATTTRIGVQQFQLVGKGKNIILFIGDAMGTAYRDAARIVAQSTNNRFREGFFDNLLEMDQMPVSGMVMTYALDRVVPDSANTATAWSSGNKTIDGTLGVFPDNDDWRYDSKNIQATKQFALNNPRIETLWEYLKRKYGYKTGIVTTADVTDATPGGEGAHTITRSLTFDVARQYADGVFTAGPTFDVILGGGMEHFNQRTAVNSGDTRDLTADLQAAGFTYVTTRTALNALPGGGSAPDKLLGLFYSAVAPVSNTGASGNMNVAYDKLGLVRPSDEPTPNFNGFFDQPFLDEMTAKAIETLSKGGAPFILMVEGASIDKQSHPNHAAGVIWDTIEFDKSVGVGRSFAAGTNAKEAKTLVLVTADHDQSMHIVGVVDSAVPLTVLNTRSISVYPRTKTPYDPFVGNVTAPSNSGSNIGEVTEFPDYIDSDGDRYPENNNQFKIGVGFRTGNHTGSSVPITAEGAGALLFTGYFDQTDIFFKMAKVLSQKTQVLDKALLDKANADGLSQNY